MARMCRASRLLIALLLELVIGFEAVRLHVGIARLDVVGQVDGDGRRFLALLAALFVTRESVSCSVPASAIPPPFAAELRAMVAPRSSFALTRTCTSPAANACGPTVCGFTAAVFQLTPPSVLYS